MKQLTLFSPAKSSRRSVTSPHNGTDTSRAAAAHIAPAAGSLCHRVFEFIASRGRRGATDHEIQSTLGLAGDTERPRRVWLQREAFIRAAGEKRMTPSGRSAAVWVTTGKQFSQEMSPDPRAETPRRPKAL
jgi:hypothetical protein